jgi:hypothetical protein
MIFCIAFLSHLVVAVAAYGIGVWHERYTYKKWLSDVHKRVYGAGGDL